MPREIHSTVIDGKRYYRLWSTIVDRYVSEPIDSKEKLREILVEEAMRIAKFNFEQEFPLRIKRAHMNGTSSNVNTRQRLDGWDDEREE